jgi:alpha-mannosidase
LFAWLERGAGSAPASESTGNPVAQERWWLAQLQPLPARPITRRVPAGHWCLNNTRLPRQQASGGGTWVQIPGLSGVAACRLERRRGAEPTGLPEVAAVDPLRVTPDGEGWLLANGLLQVRLGPSGVEQLWDGAGREQLAAPLALRRYRDSGEFWDAWDIATDYGDHPLPWSWQGTPELVEQGPLCVSFRWRGRCGGSAVRLDGRLLAGCPWLELTLAVDWRQRHELLRLELPLARQAVRWAADTSGGVIERPAEPVNPREQARWEVAAVSWLASVAAGGGASGGLAVLLDGPQGVSASAERLGVSLLRAPTWPDPGADNGWQRQRLALLPYQGSWSAAGVQAEALRLREPLWFRPERRLVEEGAADQDALVALPPLEPGLVLIGCRPAACPGVEGPVLTVQNLSPRRRRVDPGPQWKLVERLDGLDQRLDPQPRPAELDALKPWELGFWRLARVETAQS